MQTSSRSLVFTLLGAVSIHAAGLALVWKLHNSEKIVNPSVAGSKIVILNKQAPATPKTEETAQLDPFTPEQVAQFEPDSVAEIIPPSPPKPVEKVEIPKEVIAKKVTHAAEIKTPTKPVEKRQATAPKKPPKKAPPQRKVSPLIQPQDNVEETSAPQVLASSSPAPNTNNNATIPIQANVANATNQGELARKNYYSELKTWLAKHKKYPRRARLRNQEGTARLYIVVDREGNVLESSIKESSGHRLLDKEVKAMIKRAEPLPKIPDAMRQAKLEITVPVEFFLR